MKRRVKIPKDDLHNTYIYYYEHINDIKTK